MTNKTKSLLVFLLLSLWFIPLPGGHISAQVTGGDAKGDSVIVFRSPRPLVESEDCNVSISGSAGVDLLFSGSGWGLGGFYSLLLSEDLSFYTQLGISGRRNSDEFENAWLGPILIVSNKVNRLFMLPMTLGLQYRLARGGLQDSFRPFVTAGFGPTMIVATPYIRDGMYYEFFQSFGYADFFTRFSGVVGVGSYFGSYEKGPLVGIQIRYYTIPFGRGGIESIRDYPITNFGGVFLSLSLGSLY